MTELLIVFMLAFVVEAVWQALKPLWPTGLKALEKERGIPVDAIGCLVIALLLCFGAGVDLLELVGVPMAIPYIGIVLTALLIYRGSNFLHDFLEGINGIRNNTKPISWSEASLGDNIGLPDPNIGLSDDAMGNYHDTTVPDDRNEVI